MKHRKESVVGGEVKPTTSVFGEEEEEDPQVLTRSVHVTQCPFSAPTVMYSNIIIAFNDRGSLGNKYQTV